MYTKSNAIVIKKVKSMMPSFTKNMQPVVESRIGEYSQMRQIEK